MSRGTTNGLALQQRCQCGWPKYLQPESSQDPAHSRKSFLRHLRTLHFSMSLMLCKTLVALYALHGKKINFMAIMNIQSEMPSLHHTHVSHSLMLTSRTTSRNTCSSFLPIHLSLLSRQQVLSLAVSFTDILGSSHKWLTKTSINYSAEDSRDLPLLCSP